MTATTQATKGQVGVTEAVIVDKREEAIRVTATVREAIPTTEAVKNNNSTSKRILTDFKHI